MWAAQAASSAELLGAGVLAVGLEFVSRVCAVGAALVSEEVHRLREIFQNLLSNAAKFMDGPVTPRIKLGASVRYD